MQQRNSLASSLASLPETERAAVLAELTNDEAAELLYDWRDFWARPNQLPPAGDWATWFVMTGRGWGKTRTAAEFVREEVAEGRARHIALVGETAADVRDTMVEGRAGILTISPPDERPEYYPSKRKLVWPNGAIGSTFSSEDPDQLRGPEHDLAWGDEFAAWKYVRDTWDNLSMGLRVGSHPKCVLTTTPRPLTILKEIIAEAETVLTRGSTYDNLANLSERFQRHVLSRYEGTRTGRQEIDGEILDDVEGALWQRTTIDSSRTDEMPDLVQIVVAIDPAVTSGEDSDETGIIAAGRGVDGDGYVLRDATCRLSPEKWCRRAVNLYHAFEADWIVAEVNNGGDLVETVLRTIDPNVPYQQVRASRGKRTRAEPVASLYEQGRVHHVGSLADLEDQMCTFVPDDFDGSPDRVDALVWAMTQLGFSTDADEMHGLALPTAADIPDDDAPAW